MLIDSFTTDLPDPPRFSPAKCSLKDRDACELFVGLQSGISDVSSALSLLNTILTSRGLKGKDPSKVQIPESWLNIIQGVNLQSNRPAPELIEVAGEEWFTDTEAVLTLRKIQTNSTLLDREMRWIQDVLRGGFHLAKLAAKGNVLETFRKLFVGDNKILDFITSYKAISPEEYKVFSELPRKVS